MGGGLEQAEDQHEHPGAEEHERSHRDDAQDRMGKHKAIESPESETDDQGHNKLDHRRDAFLFHGEDSFPCTGLKYYVNYNPLFAVLRPAHTSG